MDYEKGDMQMIVNRQRLSLISKWMLASTVAALGLYAFTLSQGTTFVTSSRAEEAAISPTRDAKEHASFIGRKIENFTLTDYRGEEFSLAGFSGNKGVVLAVLGTQCPVAKQYGARLGEMARDFTSQGVAFCGLVGNVQDSLADIGVFAKECEIDFPILKDPTASTLDQLGATRTPEVFLLDSQGVVRYHGRVDDQYSPGVTKSSPSRHDLRIALDELISGSEITVKETVPKGCMIGRKSVVEPKGDLTWSGDVAGIIFRRCTHCHREGEAAPFTMESYDDVAPWGDTIREVVQTKRMPPWFANPEFGHFSNDARLTDDEQQILTTWIDNGMPLGNPAESPSPPKFTTGWMIGEPDQVFYVADEPIDVPANGVVEYQYFEVDPGFTEDKYVRAVEARPDNRAVVHHIVVYVVPPGEKFRPGLDGILIGYAPGMPGCVYDEGSAIHVVAGSKLIFQMHYTPNGVPQRDRSLIGLNYADPSEVKRDVRGGHAFNFQFRIPAGAENYQVKAAATLKQDERLIVMTPHMHLRGKAFRYEARYPDGRKEVLLDVPKYDFNWQLRYELAEPKLLPKGTMIICQAIFDNSENNLANPDPTEEVRWGDQTWEEMMIGYFTTIPAE